ncbi:hypothetical protein P3S67_018909 [Capsicum chacoense]
MSLTPHCKFCKRFHFDECEGCYMIDLHRNCTGFFDQCDIVVDSWFQGEYFDFKHAFDAVREANRSDWLLSRYRVALYFLEEEKHQMIHGAYGVMQLCCFIRSGQFKKNERAPSEEQPAEEGRGTMDQTGKGKQKVTDQPMRQRRQRRNVVSDSDDGLMGNKNEGAKGHVRARKRRRGGTSNTGDPPDLDVLADSSSNDSSDDDQTGQGKQPDQTGKGKQKVTDQPMRQRRQRRNVVSDSDDDDDDGLMGNKNEGAKGHVRARKRRRGGTSNTGDPPDLDVLADSSSNDSSDDDQTGQGKQPDQTGKGKQKVTDQPMRQRRQRRNVVSDSDDGLMGNKNEGAKGHVRARKRRRGGTSNTGHPPDLDVLADSSSNDSSSDDDFEDVFGSSPNENIRENINEGNQEYEYGHDILEEEEEVPEHISEAIHEENQNPEEVADPHIAEAMHEENQNQEEVADPHIAEAMHEENQNQEEVADPHIAEAVPEGNQENAQDIHGVNLVAQNNRVARELARLGHPILAQGSRQRRARAAYVNVHRYRRPNLGAEGRRCRANCLCQCPSCRCSEILLNLPP